MAAEAPEEVLDRARGALLRLTVGDALGTTLEFTVRDSTPEHTSITGGGPFGLEPGQWTDDTSMAPRRSPTAGSRGEASTRMTGGIVSPGGIPGSTLYYYYYYYYYLHADGTLKTPGVKLLATGEIK